MHLYDFFADYPLALEKQIVPENWLSLYNERLVKDKENGNRKYISGEKLIQTIHETEIKIVELVELVELVEINSTLTFKIVEMVKLDYYTKN